MALQFMSCFEAVRILDYFGSDQKSMKNSLIFSDTYFFQSKQCYQEKVTGLTFQLLIPGRKLK